MPGRQLLGRHQRPGRRSGQPQPGRGDRPGWAASFLFGRWAWDGYLSGAPVNGPGVNLIDATYKYGFARPAGKLPPWTGVHPEAGNGSAPHASTGKIDQKTGTVTLSASARSVTVQLKHAP